MRFKDIPKWVKTTILVIIVTLVLLAQTYGMQLLGFGLGRLIKHFIAS